MPELELERVIGLSPSPGALAHSPAGGDVAYCAGCVVVLFDGRANRQRAFLRAPPGGSSKPFISVAFSHDGATVAAGESGPQPAVVVWDALSGECLAQLKAHKHGIASLAFSPAGAPPLTRTRPQLREIRCRRVEAGRRTVLPLAFAGRGAAVGTR